MSQIWSSEYNVTDSLAIQLIERRFPELSPAEITYIGSGWDNTVYLVNQTYVFRFPRRNIAISLIETENKLLPIIAPLLQGAVKIPVPIFVGEPCETYPCPFSGYKSIPGVTPGERSLTKDQRNQLAKPMASFLKKLHEIPIKQAVEWGADQDTIGRLDLKIRKPKLKGQLETLKTKSVIDDVDPFLKIVEETANTKPADLSLVHGDLYFRNLLVNNDGELTGIIDWGDVHVGNPAIDLSIAFSLFPIEGRKAFFAAYGSIDMETYRLARFRALNTICNLMLYALDIDDQIIVNEARTAFANILDEF